MNDTPKVNPDENARIVSPKKNIESSKTFDLNDFAQLFEFIKTNNESKIKKHLVNYIKTMIKTTLKNEEYAFVFLYRTIGYIDDTDADNIYNSLTNQNEKNEKDVFLVLNGTGGRIEPAYLISKCCQEYKKKKFIAIIPRYAKSAATLIALGANEIHMGSLSQIGPIDPQIHGLPALGLNNALECVANLCKKYPEASSMFAEYLAKTLPLNILGYCERIPASAKDYAIRLLGNKNNILTKQKIAELAHKFVYEYKDHSFVIDKDESKILLGDKIVQIDSNEYKLGNDIYKLLEQTSMICRFIKKKTINLIGSVDDLQFIDLPKI
jgi:hypothetical protein